MKKQILKVGFDLDGVLLYNPARVVRPIIAFTKKYILKRDLNKFYYPKNRLEKWIWKLFHHTSLWSSSGIDDLLDLIKNKRIKAYVVSARYELMEADFKKWTTIIDPKKRFSGYFFNGKNEQPQIFKETMIKKLGLDVFVEDNWDIVKHLNPKAKIFWIYNILDRNIDYKYKFPTLLAVANYLKKL